MIQYVESKGWGYKPTGDQIILDKCPYCGKSDHFYAAVTGNKDGLHECKRCMKSGNLYELMVSQGDRQPGMQSQKDFAGPKEVETLPNAERCHEALLANTDALDFLMGVRGFTIDVIREQKLGLVSKRYFRDLKKESFAIVIPYIKDGKVTFAKYRSFPPDEKAFSSPSGWEPPLYNEQCINPEMQDVVFVEGEYDALSCLSNGIKNVLGVPGANLKKTVWVDLVAHVPKKYILYDNDRAGEKGAQDLAERLGLDSCYRIVLPSFTYIDDEGNEKTGKDINDWFKHGEGTLEKFELLKQAARRFNVKGVSSLGESLDDMEREYEGKEKDEPKYVSQWNSFNYKIGGWEDGDVTDILAPGKVGKTTFAMNLLDDLVARYSEPGMIICGEMTPARLARKWLSMVTKTDDSPPKSDLEAIEKAKRFREAIPLGKEIIRNREGDTYLCNPAIKEIEELYDLIRQARRRYGIKFLIVDNLQLFCDRTLRNPNHRTIHMSQLSKNLTALAKELGIVLFRIVQPRGLKDDRIADASDADGSSQIEKDCDTSISLHRGKKANITAGDFEAMGGYMDEDQAMEKETLVRVSRSRYAPGGVLTLEIDGGTSSFSEPAKAAIAAAQAKAPSSLASSSELRVESSPKNIAAITQAAVAQLPSADDITI